VKRWQQAFLIFSQNDKRKSTMQDLNALDTLTPFRAKQSRDDGAKQTGRYLFFDIMQ
jgi:hypothetical protein